MIPRAEIMHTVMMKHFIRALGISIGNKMALVIYRPCVPSLTIMPINGPQNLWNSQSMAIYICPFVLALSK